MNVWNPDQARRNTLSRWNAPKRRKMNFLARWAILAPFATLLLIGGFFLIFGTPFPLGAPTLYSALAFFGLALSATAAFAIGAE